MDAPGNFKLDQRVRERNLRREVLSEAEVQQHLDGLRDLTDECLPSEVPQPALREPSGVVVPTAPLERKPALAPPLDEDGWPEDEDDVLAQTKRQPQGEDDEDDEDEDDEDEEEDDE